jgi:diaminohydroxyphosphoribosylaminopyrimidine deaminase/5-amino-6-(5-phosphoribosylamino)uracil reductase
MERVTTDGTPMALALREARKGLGFVSPNPAVGCVIVSADGEILATGYHARAGLDHAEVDALKKITDPMDLQGAKMYVTLEPCSHHGRTPPCADAIAKTPIAEVIYGVDDPNPLVSGRGLQILRDSGKKVRRIEIMRLELEELVEIFVHNMTTHSAFAAAKVATTLDGKIAFTNGESQWITSENSRLRAHELRGHYDAVLIGARTLALDRPRLNSRHPRFTSKKNCVVIVDPTGACLKDLSSHPILEVGRTPEQIFVVVERPRSAPPGVQILECPMIEPDRFDLHHLLKELYKRGVCSVFAEGGAHTFSHFVAQRAARRIYQFISPSYMGSHETIPLTLSLGIKNMQSRPTLKQVRWEMIGDETLVTGILDPTLPS